MGQGFPEFAPPGEVVDAACKAISTPIENQYSEDRGMAVLRQAVSKKYAEFYGANFDPEAEITILCGVTEAIIAAVLATVEAGDKVAIIEPAHENYLAATGFTAVPPEGAYYVMADFSMRSSKDDVEFAMELVSRNRVAVIPGSSFYANLEVGRKLVRFAFPKPVSVIEEVGKRFGRPA